MVVKGRQGINRSRRKAKDSIITPKSHNPYIGTISALKRKPLLQNALDLMYEIANIVAPLMKEQGLKVGHLVEMSPKSDNLLGLNVNHGSKIQLRLRYPGNDLRFLPLNELVGTMLHELVHNSIGPHDRRFYEKLEEYTVEQEELIIKGIDGKYLFDPFGRKGDTLGDKKHFNELDIRKSRLARLDKKYTTESGKVGGTTSSGIQDVRKLAAAAAIRRAQDQKCCHEIEEGDNVDDDELVDGKEEGDIIIIDDDDDDDDGGGGGGESLKNNPEDSDLQGQKRNIDVVVLDSDSEDEGNKKQKAIEID